MTVVCNAGPLIALGKLGRLDLLQKLYGTVLVPQQVYEETVTSGIVRGAPDARLIREYFIRGTLLSVEVATGELGVETEIQEGEKATIQLAITRQAELVLVDDAVARELAQQRGLRLRGTLGVILEAVDRDVLIPDEAALLVERIRQRRDIWIRDTLCDLALERLWA